MSQWWKASVVVLMTAACASGQPTPVPLDQLDQILKSWEKQMSAPTLQVRFQRTIVDRAWGTTESASGWGKYMQPNLASLYLQVEGKPDSYNKYVTDGAALYEWVPAQKLIRKHPLPPQARALKQGALGFLFGISPQEARQRFHVRIAVDKDYYTIDVAPKQAADFVEAQILLHRQTFLPRRLYYVEHNGNQITWDMFFDSKAAVTRQDFAAPKAPEGWTLEDVTLEQR